MRGPDTLPFSKYWPRRHRPRPEFKYALTHRRPTEMGSSLQEILLQVRDKIVPTLAERNLIARLSEDLKDELESILASNRIQAEVSIQGSVAHDTWLRGEHDLDIFARFPESTDRREWTGKFLPLVRRGFKQYRKIERYAEHPYLELLADHKTRVNIVPCYAVEKGHWKSATDRSPHHSEYLQAHLTADLRDEARLLKKFLKGVNAYGAEIRVGGFSGMLVETLTLQFKSFVETLRQASAWKAPVFMDVEKHSSPQKFSSDFVVVDPVDPGRNLAAAVEQDKMWSFVAAARALLEFPRLSFFYPRKRTPRKRNWFLKRLDGPLYDIVTFSFPHPPLVLDVLWGQLLSLKRALVGLAERYDFHVVRSEVWSDENGMSAVLMEVTHAVLPPVRVHNGPPVSRPDESKQFLGRHLGSGDTVRGPWISGGRWMIEKERGVSSVKELLRIALHDNSLGLTIPRQLDPLFRRKARVLVNREVLPLLQRPGFAEVLADFLDGRPVWLKPSPR